MSENNQNPNKQQSAQGAFASGAQGGQQGSSQSGAQARPGVRPGVRPGARPGVRPGARQAGQGAPGGQTVSQFKMPGGGMDDQKIRDYLRAVKPRRVFRGINDEDMWTIVSNVQKFYEKQYEMEKARFEAILAEKDREIFNLRNGKK